MRDIITVGDKTSHGGVVITGDPKSVINGKPIARIGDKCTCPMRGHNGVTAIVTGDSNVTFMGIPVARAGDRTACGAVLISSQDITTVG